ncbi:methyltransferase-like 26 B [Natator depressus]|uniref:methyltransferase-like 26 B n=1 Tax=Natator depressus TaxID=27790 RepID=UPI003EBEC41F
MDPRLAPQGSSCSIPHWESRRRQPLSRCSAAPPGRHQQPLLVYLSVFSSSISSYIRATKVPNVKKPLAIDVSQPWDQWAGLSQGCCNVIIIINLLHFLAQGLEGLFQGVGQLLKPGGVCLIYGPFAINGIISPECNMKLEEELQERNPAWGLRDVEELRQMATPTRCALNACWKCQNPSNA